MRYIGLDLGTKTLGISLSNGIIATNYTTLRHEEEYDRLVEEVAKIVDEKKVDVIVLGYPKNMNNTVGERAQISEEFKKKLEEKTGKEVKKKLIIKFSVLNPMAIKVVVITKLSEPGVRKERTEQKPILLHR